MSSPNSENNSNNSSWGSWGLWGGNSNAGCPVKNSGEQVPLPQVPPAATEPAKCQCSTSTATPAPVAASPVTEKKCPVSGNVASSSSWGSWGFSNGCPFKGKSTEPTDATTTTPAVATPTTPTTTPTVANQLPSECPMRASSNAPAAAVPAPATAAPADGCPMRAGNTATKGDAYKNPSVYNVSKLNTFPHLDLLLNLMGKLFHTGLQSEDRPHQPNACQCESTTCSKSTSTASH